MYLCTQRAMSSASSLTHPTTSLVITERTHIQVPDETKAHGRDILNDPALHLAEGAVAAAAPVAAKGVTAVHAAAAAIAIMLRNPATQQEREKQIRCRSKSLGRGKG